LARTSASICMVSSFFIGVCMQISTVQCVSHAQDYRPYPSCLIPSESLVHSMFPDDPKICTLNSISGHCLCRIPSSFSTNVILLFSLSSDGSNRSYSSRISPLSFFSSLGSRVFSGSSLGVSKRASPISYCILLLLKAALVSYLQVGRPLGRVVIGPFASEVTERGEWLPNPRPPCGDGDLDRERKSRAC
jgi:hypothetical protein